MLALTRRTGEEIIIGDPTNPVGIIRVVDIHGDKVRLAFDFPRDMQINRKELADQKRKQTSGQSADFQDVQPESNENANPLAEEKKHANRSSRPAKRRRHRHPQK